MKIIGWDIGGAHIKAAKIDFKKKTSKTAQIYSPIWKNKNYLKKTITLIKKKLGKNVISIFILPPSKKELIKRLKKRAQDPNHIVKQRLSFYRMELSHWKDYKYVLVNKNLSDTVKKIKNIIEAEKYEQFVPVKSLTKQNIKAIYEAKRIAIQKKDLILKKIRSL